MSYLAFISYKHSSTSRPHAESLEIALKRYGKPLWKPPIAIFRDERVFRPGDDLPSGIRKALEQSEFLLYLASKEAAESVWVQDELRIWCQELQRANRLVIVHIGDSLTANPATRTIAWAETDALPRLLEPYIQSIPIWTDLSWARTPEDRQLANENYGKAINAIVARFRGKTPGEMNDAEVLTHRRNIAIRNAGIAAIALSGLLAAYFGVQSGKQARLADERARNVQIAEAFRQIDRGNESLRVSAVDEGSKELGDAMARFHRLGLDPVMALHSLFAAGLQTREVTPIAELRGEAGYMLVSADGDLIAVLYDYYTPAGDNEPADIPDWPAVGVYQSSTDKWILVQSVASPVGKKVYREPIGAVGLIAPYDLILRRSDGSLARLSLLNGSEIPCDPGVCAEYLSRESAGDLPANLQHVLDDDELSTMPDDGSNMGYGPRLEHHVLEISPDRRTAILGSYTGRLRLLDLRSGHVGLQQESYEPIYAAAYQKDGRRAYFCDKGRLYEVDMALPRGVAELNAGLQVDPANVFRSERVLAVAFSDDASRLAVATTRRLTYFDVRENRWLEWRLPKETDRAAALRVTADNRFIDLVSGDDGALYSASADSSSLHATPSPTGGKPVVAWLEGNQAWLAETTPINGTARIRAAALPGRTATPVDFSARLTEDEPRTVGFGSPMGVHAVAKLGEELVLFYGDEEPSHAYETRNERMTVLPLHNRRQQRDRVVFEVSSSRDALGEEHWTSTRVDTLLPSSRGDRMLAMGSNGVDTLTPNGEPQRAVGNLFVTEYRDQDETYSFGIDQKEDTLFFVAIHSATKTSLRTQLPWGFDRAPQFAAISSDGRRIAVADWTGDILFVGVSVFDTKMAEK